VLEVQVVRRFDREPAADRLRAADREAIHGRAEIQLRRPKQPRLEPQLQTRAQLAGDPSGHAVRVGDSHETD
jgi:hypothetical protein